MKNLTIKLSAGCAILLLALTTFSMQAEGCSTAAREAGWNTPAVAAPGIGADDLASLLAHLRSQRVVYIGEHHDRYEHHLNQLEIICRLRDAGPMIIGLEFFDVTRQAALDAYVNDHGDLDRLLRESGWFDGWRFDPRLYSPIFAFARQHRIPLVALNVPRRVVRTVSREGLDQLDPADQKLVPASIRRGPAAYVKRIRNVFEHHHPTGPGAAHTGNRGRGGGTVKGATGGTDGAADNGSATPRNDFENFLSAQLVWDEGMAQRGAEALLSNPDARLVVLAGEGHVINGDGIPDRLARRLAAARTIIIQSDTPVDALPDDHVRLTSAPIELPRPARLGVRLVTRDDALVVEGFGADSSARDAGIEEGDRLLAVDGAPLRRFSDIRLALWDRPAGSPVTLSVQRGKRTWSVRLALR